MAWLRTRVTTPVMEVSRGGIADVDAVEVYEDARRGGARGHLVPDAVVDGTIEDDDDARRLTTGPAFDVGGLRNPQGRCEGRAGVHRLREGAFALQPFVDGL